MNGRAKIHHHRRGVTGGRPRPSVPGAMGGLVPNFALIANTLPGTGPGTRSGTVTSAGTGTGTGVGTGAGSGSGTGAGATVGVTPGWSSVGGGESGPAGL